MNQQPSLAKHPSARFVLNKERVATQCVCCGSKDLSSSPAILMPFVADRVFGWAPIQIDDSWGLSTISNGKAYSICKSMCCRKCGHVFLDIRFSEDELTSLYKGYRGEEYRALRDSYEPGYSARNSCLGAGVGYVSEIENFLTPYLEGAPRILDWGGDTGKNTPFKQNNLTMDIYDISAKDVVPGARSITKQQALMNRYDLVVCSNVLEHIPYPTEVLLDIRETLDAKSVLYIEVPYEDVMRTHKTDPHLKKRHWHEHINFFSDRSLPALIESVGLRVLELRHFEAIAGDRECTLFQVACCLDDAQA